LPPYLSPIEYKRSKNEVTNSISQSCMALMNLTIH